MDTVSTATGYSKLVLKQVIVSISLPPCHPYSRARIVQQLTKRQLKQFQSDTLSVHVLTNPPRLSLIAMPKAQDKIYLFAEDVNVADACAHQFYSDALARLQTLEPNSGINASPNVQPESSDGSTAPYKIASLVARANAVPAGTPSIVDLMELEKRILAKCDPSALAIFEPEEYPGLVWLDVGENNEMLLDLNGSEIGADVECEMKTLVFASGAIVVHGSSLPKMEDSLRRKLPLIQKCMRPVPESVADLLMSRT